MSPGKMPAPANTRCGAPTATATIIVESSSARRGGKQHRRWSRWRTPSTRTSMATARSVFRRSRIEAHGSTSLVQVGSNYYLESISSGTGPELQYHGAAGDRRPVQLGWTPIGAEQTASGYDVAWKIAGANQYAVWSTDSNGNYHRQHHRLRGRKQRRAGNSGDDVPAGPQWRRRDRYIRNDCNWRHAGTRSPGFRVSAIQRPDRIPDTG